jgi:hypothetical protein
MTHRPSLYLIAVFGLLACRGAAPEPTPPARAAEPATPAPTAARPAPQAATLHWTDPAPWRRGTPSSAMRIAQYEVPGAGPNTEGELTVFWFGAGRGGSIDDNLNRWYGQFTQPDGRPTSAVATRERRTVRGLAVTVTRAGGRFAGAAMPGSAPSAPRENHALLAAIVETPNGPWFFKLTGPAATLASAGPVFDQLVESFEFR